jgi:hypothetical protein
LSAGQLAMMSRISPVGPTPARCMCGWQRGSSSSGGSGKRAGQLLAEARCCAAGGALAAACRVTQLGGGGSRPTCSSSLPYFNHTPVSCTESQSRAQSACRPCLRVLFVCACVVAAAVAFSYAVSASALATRTSRGSNRNSLAAATH